MRKYTLLLTILKNRSHENQVAYQHAIAIICDLYSVNESQARNIVNELMYQERILITSYITQKQYYKDNQKYLEKDTVTVLTIIN